MDGCTYYHPHPVNNQARQENVTVASEHTNTSQVQSVPVLLQVIPITVHGPSGYLNTHAMLDNGSTCSLVLAAVADKLGLEGLQERVILNAIQGKSELNSKRVSMHVSPVNLVSPLYEVSRALVVDSLNVPHKKVNLVDLKSKWSHLKDLNIPEASGCEVSMLIGSDCLDIIIPIETRVGPKGTPIGICTKLGWTITGPPPDHARDYEDIYHVHVPSPNEELRDKVKSWWRTEEFGCKYDADSQWSIEDEQVMCFLDETTTKIDGRYEVGSSFGRTRTQLFKTTDMLQSID